MIRRPIHLLALACFVSSLLIFGGARGQSEPGTFEPAVETLDGASFVALPDTITANALPGAVIRESPVRAAPAPFTHLMLRWRVTASEAATVMFDARASLDGQTWTEWGSVGANHDLDDAEDPPDVHWSNTVYAGVAGFWQLRLTTIPAPGEAMPVLQDLQVHTIDTRNGSVPETPPDDINATAFDLETFDITANAFDPRQRPAFVPRSAWGGANVEARSVAARYHPATHLVVHHTADANALVRGESNWGDRVRAEWAFHTYSRGWGDIGYNWLIDPNGVVYEGRKGTADLQRDAVGFHDTANYGSMGVALLGSFGGGGPTAQAPTRAALNSLLRLFAWKAYQRGIDPLGSSVYYGCSRSPSCARINPRALVPTISGHKQITGRTACPGDLTMNVLDALRRAVRNAISSPLPASPPAAEPPAPSAVPPTPTATTPPPTATPTATVTPSPTPSPTMTPSPTPSPTPRPQTRIEGAAHWTIADSPVVLTQDQNIPAGSSLLIDAGVEVQLAPEVDVYVAGALHAAGTADAPVRFTGMSGRWGAVIGLPGNAITLEHTTVEGGGNGGVVLTAAGGASSLANVVVAGNGGGMRFDGAAVTLRDSRVAANDLITGPAIDIRMGPEQPVTIEDNRIDGAGTSAGATQLKVGVTGAQTGALLVQNNVVVDGTGALIELEAAAPMHGAIRCNTLDGGAIGLKLSASTPSATGFELAIADNALGGQSNVGIASTIALEAGGNWWGAASGPSDAQRNPTGGGVRVGVNVDFDPVLAELPGCAP